MRPLVEKALDLTRSAGGGPPYLVVSAPTGYGKTVSAPLIASELVSRGFCYSFIHSLPLRAIVRDAYRCLILNSLIDDPRLRDECRKSGEVLDVVEKALRGAGIGIGDVAYQMGEYLSNGELETYQRKEPLFDARYVVTTLDSLVLNMFRIPVAEFYSYRKHYTIPWSRIYVSAILLDEAHAIVEDYDESSRSRAFTVFKVLLEVAGAARIPVVVSSATLPERLVEAVVSSLGGGVAVVELGRSAEERGNRVVVRDEDFESSVLSVKWGTRVIGSSEVIDKVVERVSSGRRVFVACDSISRAVSLYRELSTTLGEGSVVLLHSMLKMGDREERLRRLSSYSTKVLVATSVVEAGVDVSFDDLVTDGGNPFSVVQRIGRVCRYLDCGEAEVYVVKEFSDPQLVEFVERYGDRVMWRLPYDADDMVSYRKLLEAVSLEEDHRIRGLLEVLLYPLLIPQNDIGRVLRELGGSLLREFLVTVVVGDGNKLSGVSYEEVLRSTVVMDFERLKELVSRDCVYGLYVLLKEKEDPTKVAEVRPVNLELGRVLGRGRLRGAVGEYIEKLGEIYREHRSRVIAVAFLAKEECYGATGLGYV